VRISSGGGPSEDSLATLTLSCTDSGNGWTNVLAALPTGAASGSPARVEATLTDWTGTTLNTVLEGTLE
jgi:hypothetical protein